MIAGVLLYSDKTKETLFRSTYDYEKSIVSSFINTFVKLPKKSFGVFSDHLNYVYTSNGTFFICIITSFPSYVIKPLLQSYKLNMKTSILDNLCIIDDTINKFTFINLNSSDINDYLVMESQEEKLHDMVAKNKEAEMARRLNDIKKNDLPNIIDIQLEKVKDLELEIRKPAEKIIKKEPKDIFKQKKVSIETSSEIQLTMKERLKVILDKDANVKSCEVDGDLGIIIAKEEFCDCQIKINTGMDLRYSPNLDKKLTKSNILRSLKSFPIKKNLALVKWKKNQIENMPISFTFWPSDLGNGRFQIMFEVNAEENLKDLTFCFNKENIKDVVIESGNASVKEFLEWNVGELKKNEIETLEFSCSCFSPDEVFPINLFFVGNFLSSEINVESIKNEEQNLNFATAFICEVDSFVIVCE